MKKTHGLLYVLLAGIFAVTGVSSCAPVKGYQKKYLNDAEMQLSARRSEKFENSFQAIREGASGANGGKTGGGCGCN